MGEAQQKRIVVTVIGRDQVGIVAKIATVLAETDVNIHDINQKILGDEIFAMTMLADRLNSQLSLIELTERLNGAVADMGLDVRVQDAEVFRYMHRV
jgi:ACT domain-containing protein